MMTHYRENEMRKLITATVGLLMLSGVAMAQTTTATPQTPATGAPGAGNGSGYSTNGGMISSNGAAVAPNGGLQKGVGTTLVNPSAPTTEQHPVGSNTGK